MMSPTRDNKGYQAAIEALAGKISEGLRQPHFVVSPVKVALFGINTPVGIAGSFFCVALGRIKGLAPKALWKLQRRLSPLSIL
ncbi:hypothetical protein [Arthrobacter sp. ZBG10]|uniref:hypothetical protein n=1 Tax=Arthrobacter sp. ZBG10 TaxID=1676590 RepID=UPI000A5ACC88|nr:hypothetical protein [Arthrobacter sp. ZBG10]